MGRGEADFRFFGIEGGRKNSTLFDRNVGGATQILIFFLQVGRRVQNCIVNSPGPVPVQLFTCLYGLKRLIQKHTGLIQHKFIFIKFPAIDPFRGNFHQLSPLGRVGM